MGRLRRKFENMDIKFDENGSDERYYLAYKRVKKIKGFYVHFLVYVLVNLFIIGKKYFDNDAVNFLEWETFSTPVFWGIGLLAHGLSVFGGNLFFGKNWEEKKNQELMENEKAPPTPEGGVRKLDLILNVLK